MKHFIVITVGLTFVALLARADEQILFVSNRHENDDIYRNFRNVRMQRLTFADGVDYNPALSPNGTKMAYVSVIDRNPEIAIMDLKFGKRQQLTFSRQSRHNLHPTWSPDGRRIAFSSDRDGDFDIYIMDANGNNVTNMTDNSSGDDGSPHWSPVSQKVVFTSNRDGAADEIYLLDAQTGIQRRLTTSSYDAAYPKWSPNGSQIAYLPALRTEIQPNTQAIWRVKPDGTDLEALVSEGIGNWFPKYSPDGKRIAFVSSRNSNRDIYALNLETKELTRLTTHLRIDSDPDWSPDGERIAFVSDRDGSPGLFTMTVNRKQITNLTNNDMVERRPTWSHDGEKIAFSRRIVDDSTRIFVMDSDGENEFELVDLPFSNDYPAWSPRGDQIAFVNRPEQGEPKSLICTVDPNGKNLQVIYENPDKRIWEIAWSGDGAQIIFRRSRGRIAFLDIVTQEVRTIDVPAVDLYAPAWSPNGQAIIFTGYMRFENLERRPGVFIIDRDGNPVRTILMDTPPSTIGGLAWSPDGNKILFGRDGGLHTLDLDTEATELFIEGARDPDWQDPSLPRSVSPQNKLNTTWGEMKKSDKR